MTKKWNSKGFTLAETLITVAIILVLCGLGFVAVQNHQASLTQMEYDTIAKELFIAAQNHIVLAESQGYLGKSTDDFGTEDTVTRDGDGNDIEGDYYIVTDGGNIDEDSMLAQLLPLGSIDETIRTGGSYIIHYQPSSGTILDVFFSRPSDRRGTPLSSVSYADLMDPDIYYGEDNKSARRDVDGKVVGWFGDAEALPMGAKLTAPTVKIHNEEKLWVEVVDNNPASSGATTVLIITGKTSGAQCMFTMGTVDGRVATYNDVIGCAAILDDITSDGNHFADLVGQNAKSFIPGEDIDVEAVAYNNSALTNVAYSGKQKTNSLFKVMNILSETDSVEMETVSVPTVQVENFRHLANLSHEISNFAYDTCCKEGAVERAEQIEDLIWMTGDKAFQNRIPELPNTGTVPAAGEVRMYKFGSGDGSVSEKGYFFPVNPENCALVYNGNKHSVKEVKVNLENGNAGLFGSISDGAISDLQLIDFSITGSVSAGALVGATENTEITNVIAISSKVGTETTTDTDITASSGASGGLIGIQDGGSVTYCAASLMVRGNTNAGGLIGTAKNHATVVGSYSGGHTLNGKYSEWINKSRHCDVVGATAGGLIGNAGDTAITNSYSTCSVNGTSIGGGFAGIADGKIVNCYCTGRVFPDFDDSNSLIDNAFVGNPNTEHTLATGSSGYFFELINELQDPASSSFLYKSSGSSAISAFDRDIDIYNNFVGNNWKKATPYDKTALEKYYDGNYMFKTIEQLENSDWSSVAKKDNFVKMHYGDWPVAEQFLINK